MSTMIATFRRAKAIGITARESWEIVAAAVNQQDWRPSEKAATLADRARELRTAYGKRDTRFLFEDADKEKRGRHA